MRFYNSGRYDIILEYFFHFESLLTCVLLSGKKFLFCNARFLSSRKVRQAGRQEEEVLYAAQDGWCLDSRTVLRLCANFAHRILEPVPHRDKSLVCFPATSTQ